MKKQRLLSILTTCVSTICLASAVSACSKPNQPKPEFDEGATTGLEYTLIEETNSYTITGRGTATDKQVILSSRYKGLPVTKIAPRAFYDWRSITSITIPNSITEIGYNAFDYCVALTSVTIPDSVKSIGSHAFNECFQLTNITLPNSITEIEKYTFSKCTRLTSITLSQSITSISMYAFWQCSSLTSIIIPNSVTSIGGCAFSDCNALTIYCETIAKPIDWDDSWNYSNCPVVWGYKGD